MDVKGITAPGVVLGMNGEVAFRRILMDIPAGLNKVRWSINYSRSISSLENMSDIIIFFIEINGVTGMKDSDDFLEWDIMGFD
ncbi:hypothetical protein FGG79_18195 [Bacillus sp. BHET2]|uniref:hypothetical protein n=1 Tax=Bacillus sp. BHET2 TaxID=2583818 RepID=UPI00110DA7C4|nr:hypothetical protein [Bacillus sp. BHET2]TMU84067.1 hypothetical protein FGG79_18195 [Bacillus sp. BHET2]